MEGIIQWAHGDVTRFNRCDDCRKAGYDQPADFIVQVKGESAPKALCEDCSGAYDWSQAEKTGLSEN
jgi:hypothetical protein